MVARNDITGDAIQTRQPSENYANNYDRIFGKKVEEKSVMQTQYEIATERLKKHIGDVGLLITFKPYAELTNPQRAIDDLYSLASRIQVA